MAGGQMQQRASTAVATVPRGVGTYRDPAVLTKRMQELTETAHLVSPATECGSLPEGCEVALSAVLIDTATPEVYGIAGRKGTPDETVGLSKTALDKIVGAVGGTWVTEKTGRLDDGSDPRYCHYRAVLRVLDFDGTPREFPGEVEIDARDGSPQIEEIITKARNAVDYETKKPKPRDPKPQIIELRKFLLRHAESKAMNRAIRKLGVRTSYKRSELAKPFVAARVLFNGRTDDPELRRVFASRIADTFLASRSAAFGGGSVPALPAARAARVIDVPHTVSHGAPPVGAVPALPDDEDAPFGREPQPLAASDNGGNRQPPADSSTQRAELQPQQARQPKPGQIDTSQFVVPFGKNQGTPLNEASDRDLTYLADVLPKSIDDPEKSRYRAKNEALLAAVLAEQEYRELEGPGDLFDGAQDGAGGGF